jgi:ribosomal protein S18 acetylase RimI-like enzyme
VTLGPAEVGTRIHAYLRASLSAARETTRVGPFLASFAAEDALRFLNYAVPDDGAAPQRADVQALEVAFRRRDRMPRLEYVPAAAPAVEGALLDAGWVPEGRLPLMILPADIALEADLPEGIEIVSPSSSGDYLATAAAQNEAYGDDPPGPDGGAGLRRTVDRGGRVVMARDRGSSDVVGGGLFPAPQDRVTEVAAIGVRAAYRRRGIATAMVRCLAREARDLGVETIFLMAESSIEEGIYARIGFETIGEMLHISRPGP